MRIAQHGDGSVQPGNRLRAIELRQGGTGGGKEPGGRAGESDQAKQEKADPGTDGETFSGVAARRLK